jgi:diguanylate cyclase (GGDEF)-like protein/PAS domain S-box-containing protein
VLDRVTGTWSIYLARKFVGPNGEFLGLVLGAIRLQYFERFFGTIALGEDSAISLFRSDGVLLARYPARDSPGRSYAQGRLFKNVLSHTDHGVVWITSIVDGKERLIGGHRLGHYPIVVGVARTVDAALAEWRSAAMYMTGAAVLLILVIGATVLLSIWQIKNYELLVRVRAENDQKAQLDAALNNMRQGLLMFDSAGRLVLYNQRFLQMYHLSAEAVEPGCTLSDLLRLRKAAGTFKGNPDQYVAKLVDADGTFKGDPDRQIAKLFDEGKVETKVMELPDGRITSITNQSMPGGGWVSTHEDITERRRAEEERDRNREFLDLIIENVPVPVFVKDASKRQYVLINRAAEKFWGIPRGEMIGRTAYDMFPKQDADLIATREDELVKSGELNCDEREIHTPRNGIRLASSKRLTVSDHHGKPKYLIGVLEDATEWRRLERERDRSQTFLNTVIENVPVTIFVKEAREQRYVLVNRAAEQLWGVSRNDVIGKTAHDLFPKSTADLIAARDTELLESKHQLLQATHSMEMPNHESRLITSRRIAILGDDEQPQYLLGVIEDVTERARSEARIAHLAHHDMLTDLPNRLLFSERLDQALARVHRGERLAVLYLDLDHFKRINDTLGHPIGDGLLKAVADRLRSCVREIDSLARLGGDEFAIVQTSLEQPSDAATLATRIREAIKAPYVLDGHKVQVDVSIGIAIAPNEGTERDQLLKNADMALYGGKTAGRGIYCFFEPEMNERMKARHQLEHDLRKALVSGEFELFYQPLVDLQDNEISAFEALLRWHHPERGMISPAEFISVAEEVGLIIPLGEWVLKTACTEAATWPDKIKLAVNLSPAQLTSNNLMPVIISALAASGLPARRLELEITESVLMQNTFATLDTLHQLRKLGVRIAMDDFGTGHSSLSYLLSFPFDKIKIDRCFIKGLPDENNSLAIVRAIASLASSLDMTTVVEGVETQQQREMVKALGCTEMQGYVFSPPRPAAEISRLFLSHAEREASAA